MKNKSIKYMWYGFTQEMQYDAFFVAETEKQCLQDMKNHWYNYRKGRNPELYEMSFEKASDYFGWVLPKQFKLGESIGI